jgi:hypothetical protein
MLERKIHTEACEGHVVAHGCQKMKMVEVVESWKAGEQGGRVRRS